MFVQGVWRSCERGFGIPHSQDRVRRRGDTPYLMHRCYVVGVMPAFCCFTINPVKRPSENVKTFFGFAETAFSDGL